MTAPKTPEAAVLHACLHWLALRGIKAWRNNSGVAMMKGRGGRMQPVRFGARGQADILGILPGGRFLAVECKSSTGKTTEDQEAFLREVNRLGGLAIVARSIDDLEAALPGGRAAVLPRRSE